MQCASTLATIVVFTHQARAADEVDAAYALCQSIMNTGLAAECEVSGWDGAVDAWLDTNSAEAREICAGMVELIAQQTDAFARRRAPGGCAS